MRLLTKFLTNLVNKYTPDAFVIAIGLTFITFILSMVVEGENFIDTTLAWGNGLWDLLGFTMQMVLILITGYVLASVPFVDNFTTKIANKVEKPRTAIIIATLAGAIGAFLNWGFGVILGALTAKKLAQNVKGVHYPLIIAAGFTGMGLYGFGFSASIPLIISTPGHFLEEQIGIIPLTDTILTIPMLLIVLIILITLPIVNSLQQPNKKEDIIEIEQPNEMDFEEIQVKTNIKSDNNEVQTPGFGEKLNNSRILGKLLGLLGIVFIFFYIKRGGDIEINTVNFILLFLGISLFKTPIDYANKLAEGAKVVAGIILQYPFYSGIMAILVTSGLVDTLAEGFISISSAATLPFWSVVSGFFVNVLAPSAGGQWAVQGPIMIQAAIETGAKLNQVAMGVMIGDSWNTVVQPFWLLPALALAGLRLREVIGYTIIPAIWFGVVIVPIILIWGYTA